MSPLMSSHGAAAFATAVAVSGTVMLLAFCRQKQLPTDAARFAALDAACSSISPPPHCGRLRPCISSAERKRERANGSKKKKRRVHFAEEVTEFELDGEQDRLSSEEEEDDDEGEQRRVVAHRPRAGAKEVRRDRRNMQANRQALYNGIMQDRMQRMTCSY